MQPSCRPEPFQFLGPSCPSERQPSTAPPSPSARQGFLAPESPSGRRERRRFAGDHPCCRVPRPCRVPSESGSTSCRLRRALGIGFRLFLLPTLHRYTSL